jgi:hypothetical protein
LNTERPLTSPPLHIWCIFCFLSIPGWEHLLHLLRCKNKAGIKKAPKGAIDKKDSFANLAKKGDHMAIIEISILENRILVIEEMVKIISQKESAESIAALLKELDELFISEID